MSLILNDVAITGTVSGFKYNPNEKVMHFSLRHKDGTFHVKVYGLENIRLCEQLTEGQPVHVLGKMRSFVNPKKGNSHDAYIWAKTLIPVDDSSALKELLIMAGIQAIFDARNKNGHSDPD